MTLFAFTAKHKLEDAEEQYLRAIYRFRKAETCQSLDYRSARREMNRLEAELLKLRQSIYSNEPYYTYERKRIDQSFSRCPEPAWDSKLKAC